MRWIAFNVAPLKWFEVDIRAGLLIAIGKPIDSKAAYWQVMKPEPGTSRHMHVFRNWLARQIRLTRK